MPEGIENTGSPLKPSSIISTTLPKHAESGIHEFTEDFEIPVIELISTAKRTSVAVFTA